MTAFIKSLARLAAALTILGWSAAAAAGPIYVEFRSTDGTAVGQFGFHSIPNGEVAPIDYGQLQLDGRVFEAALLSFEYTGILDSLQVRIFGDESTGLATGEFVTLFFGNADSHELVLPTHGYLLYDLGGKRGGTQGQVVPEPAALGLVGLAGVGLLAARGRKAASTA